MANLNVAPSPWDTLPFHTFFWSTLCLTLTPAPASFSGCFPAPAAIAASNCVKLQHTQEKAFEFGRAFIAQAAVPDVPSEIWMEVTWTTLDFLVKLLHYTF